MVWVMVQSNYVHVIENNAKLLFPGSFWTYTNIHKQTVNAFVYHKLICNSLLIYQTWRIKKT